MLAHCLRTCHLLSLALFLAPLAVDAALCPASHAHGGGGGDPLETGEFRARPVITIEGHSGYELNLEGRPEHYAIDGLFGVVMEWGLGHGSSLTIEAALGPALVWGEAEHFYGRVHTHDHGDHDDHGHEHGGHHDDHADHEEEEHDHEEHHAEHDDDHDGHDDHHDHGGHTGHGSHAHAHDTDFKRTDIKGYLQVRYAPNDRLSLSLEYEPYYVTRNQDEDIQGLKNELGAKVLWALGDGDVNLALGDGLQDMIDGVYLSVEHRQGWESDGTWLGNYTDPRLGIGFNIDLVSISIDAGPRFYTPGSYSGLQQRTDFAGELEVTVPVAENVVLFVHREPTYSSDAGPGWGEGWQHHVGTGVTFTF